MVENLPSLTQMTQCTSHMASPDEKTSRMRRRTSEMETLVHSMISRCAGWYTFPAGRLEDFHLLNLKRMEQKEQCGIIKRKRQVSS